MGEVCGPVAVSRLIGDRWNLDGLLASRIRAQPFSVGLLDEIEKAHPQALHLLLQLFDEGRLTDAAGDVASFASAVVIMTSNLGSRTAAPIGFGETRDRILADVAQAVRGVLPSELFNPTGPYLLEGALDVASAALEPAVAQAVDALERIQAARAYQGARDAATGELRYYVEELANRVAALEELFGVNPHMTRRREREDEHDS